MKADETLIMLRKYVGRYPKFITIIRTRRFQWNENRLQEIQASLKENDLFQMKKHIGLMTVDKRIKLICSERYSVSVDSVLGVGTTVQILIPKITDDTET